MRYGELEIASEGERTIVLTRRIAAPRHTVFEAVTRPDRLRRWLAPHGWSIGECAVDLRLGGEFRYVLTGPRGERRTIKGEWCHVAKEERLVHWEAAEDGSRHWQVATSFVDEGDRTRLRVTMDYASREIRDAVLAAGMAERAADGYDRLEALVTPEPLPLAA